MNNLENRLAKKGMIIQKKGGSKMLPPFWKTSM